MTMRLFISLLLFGPLLGCAVLDGETPAVEVSQSALSTENRLVYNRLVYNRLVYNRLVYNRLVYNRLADNRLMLDPTANDAGMPIEATAEGRDLLTYIARCAFGSGEILVAQYNGQTYEFPGLLGLAPEWADQPLTLAKQRRISACLLAHVNAFGTSVIISLRADGVLPASTEERLDYPVYEATFFGQVFGDGVLKTYACQGDDGSIAQAHSLSRALRVCADGTGACGITALGRCRDICEQRIDEQGWTRCYAQGVRYDETISAYLYADDLDGQNQICGTNEDCQLSTAPATAAILDCSEGNNCDATCRSNGTCTLDGAIANSFKVVVEPYATAEVGCLSANNCNMTCREAADCELECLGANNCVVECRPGSTCTLDCRGANNCNQVTCRGAASCVIECGSADSCGFAQCPTGAVSCGGGVIACNHPCP